MRKWIKAVSAVAIAYVLLYAEYRIIGYDEYWLSILACTIFIYMILFTEHSYHLEKREIQKEYILNLQNDTIGELFDAKKYASYKKQYSGKDGNDYLSPTGEMICTKYVSQKQEVRVWDSSIGMHIFCIAIIGIAFIVWEGLIKNGQVLEHIQPHLTYVWNKIQNIIVITEVRIIQIKEHIQQISIEKWTYLMQCIEENISIGMSQGQILLEHILENIRQLIADLKNKF